MPDLVNTLADLDRICAEAPEGDRASLLVARDVLVDRDVQMAYELARAGDWRTVQEAWGRHEMFARECAHHVKPRSGWSFLHQAAFWGREAACRELIRWGADIHLTDKDGMAPSQVATARGHGGLAALLDRAGENARHLWTPPPDSSMLPSSNAFSQGTAWTPPHDDRVCYGGGVAVITASVPVWVDDFRRVIVGWHGTTTPPLGMDGQSMIPGVG
ncbi:ankyrin repeat domain-containing protein [Propionibacterium australiense]|uniref:Ankyrin repeat domain-containing protein n=1 Tax=Propionibacterium australiense TaxID=119981 RepID=A0A8B3FQ05_9ACTN|nr:ankyrin repeat domain-containing protein [Propionibacterium australiense]RLP08123.1 ankyrin repeat domain-containing protein [Propionibacterium australiense]